MAIIIELDGERFTVEADTLFTVLLSSLEPQVRDHVVNGAIEITKKIKPGQSPFIRLSRVIPGDARQLQQPSPQQPPPPSRIIIP